MAPNPKPVYDQDERCLCFHGQLLYEAKVIKVDLQEEGNKKSGFKYLVHYKGWKKTWDDWATDDRMRKFNDENLDLKHKLESEFKRAHDSRKPTLSSASKRKSGRADSILDSEDRSSSVGGRANKRTRDDFIEKHEEFVMYPSVRFKLPDMLKSLLVDDWEAITKNQTILPLPSATPVSQILNAYQNQARRRPGSPDADILDEVVVGLLEYFNRALGRILLYRIERPQFLELQELMDAAPGTLPPRKKAKLLSPTRDGFDPADLAGKTPADIYGAEHLVRLFVSLPELIAQTNMDKQAVQRLREELEMFALWLSRHSHVYFTKDYDSAEPEYLAKAKTSG